MRPSESMLALCGRRLNPKLYARLEQEGFHVIQLPENQVCYEPVNNHPDIFVCPLQGCQEWIVAPQIRPYLEQYLLKHGLSHLLTSIKSGSKSIGLKYPDNAGYNVLELGKTLLLRKTSADLQVLNFAEVNGYDLLDVNQGYVRCTTVALSSEVLITSDRSIQKVLIAAGKDVLFVKPDGIVLRGFPYGFIGGCAMVLPNKVVYFYGNLSQHEQYYDIIDFTTQHGFSCEWLADIPLEDIGGVSFLFQK